MSELIPESYFRRPNYDLRNTAEGMPGVVVEFLEDGTTVSTPVVSRSLRAVIPSEVAPAQTETPVILITPTEN